MAAFWSKKNKYAKLQRLELEESGVPDSDDIDDTGEGGFREVETKLSASSSKNNYDTEMLDVDEDSSNAGHRDTYHASPLLFPYGINWKGAIFSSLIASLGGILFGYDLGVISGAILSLETDFILSTMDKVRRP